MVAPLDPYNTPALLPPDGVVSNLVDPYTKQPILVGKATVCIGIRLYNKIAILKQLHVEDFFLVFAGLGFDAFTVVMIASGNAGQGKHQWNVSVADLMRVALLANILEILYGPVMFAAKATVLLSLKRIFEGTQRNFVHWSFITLIALNGLFYVSMLFAFIFACVPRAKITNPFLPGVCISTNGSILATSASNIISDVTWAISPVGLWALAEFSTMIIAGCFPIFPRFFKHLRNGGRARTIYSDSYTKSHGSNSYKHATNYRRNHHILAKTTVSAAPWGQLYRSCYR